MKKKAEADHNTTIQFRPGESFGKRLTNLERTWGIPRQEVVRRLAIMASYDLTLALYDPLAEAAESLGGLRGFEQACEYVNGAFHGASLVQPEPGGFTDAETKRKFVVRALCVLTGRTDMSQLAEEEERQAEEKQRKQQVKQVRY